MDKEGHTPTPVKKRKTRLSAKVKKRIFLEALERSLGNVLAAERATGIKRDNHYDWIKNDEDYKKAIEELPDKALDFAEGKLMKLVDEQHPTAVIFFLKTKGKDRGYTERTEHTGEVTVNAGVRKIREMIRNDHDK